MKTFFKQFFSLSSVVFLGLFYGMQASAASPDQELVAHLNAIHSMEAGFEQVVRAGERVVHQTKGEMSLQRGGYFRWKTQEPMKQLIVTNGKTLWIYDQDLKQVIVKPVKSNEANSPAELLSGHANQLVSYYRVMKKRDDGFVNYILRPKNPKMNFTYILFRFDQNKLLQMQLVDQVGQNSDLRFSHISMNQPLSANQFEFKIPPDIDVVKE